MLLVWVKHGSTWSALTTLPVALWEVSLGVWLVVKELNLCRTISAIVELDQGPARAALVLAGDGSLLRHAALIAPIVAMVICQGRCAQSPGHPTVGLAGGPRRRALLMPRRRAAPARQSIASALETGRSSSHHSSPRIARVAKGGVIARWWKEDGIEREPSRDDGTLPCASVPGGEQEERCRCPPRPRAPWVQVSGEDPPFELRSPGGHGHGLVAVPPDVLLVEDRRSQGTTSAPTR